MSDQPKTESSAGVPVAGTSRPRFGEVSIHNGDRLPPAPFSWPLLVATFFGLGRLRPGPGTWGSAATVILWTIFAYTFPGTFRLPISIGLVFLIIIIGIPAATFVSRTTGVKDPQFVVIDEVAGQLVALIGVPLEWKSFLAAFILFRVFDILKPPPVRQLEALPEGAGIVLDDVAAGLYALAIMHLLLHFGLLR